MSGVTAVVPNWNRRDLLSRLLDLLGTQTYPIQEVIVVDNGSDDGSVELARSKGARVITLKENLGFAGAVNEGIREARTEWIAVLNNDVEPETNWLERLAHALAEPRVWFATGKLLSASRPGSLDGAFDVVCRGACAWRAGQGRKDSVSWSQRRRIRLAPFTAALFRAELFKSVGFLDEQFESYLEDVDFGLRCALRGYYGIYEPAAVARHLGSATLGGWHKEMVRLIARNQVLLVAKHYPARYFLRYGWQILVAQVLWGVVATRHGRVLSYLRGKAEGLALFWQVRHRVAQNGGFPRGLSRILEHGESEIYRLQKRSGFDLYWRLYFALTC